MASISKGTFYNCESLSGVTIPNSVTYIGDSAFHFCTRLSSITIPNSLTSIEKRAFYRCTNLSDVYYSGSEEDWNGITVKLGNNDLLNANIHFNSRIKNENLNKKMFEATSSKKWRYLVSNHLFEDINKSMDHYSIEQVFEPLTKFGIDFHIDKNARKSDPDAYLTFDSIHLLVKLQNDHIIVYEPEYGYEQAIIKTTYGALYYCLKEYNSVSFSRSRYRVNEVKKEITPDTELYGIKMSEYFEQDDPFEYAYKAKLSRLK